MKIMYTCLLAIFCFCGFAIANAEHTDATTVTDSNRVISVSKSSPEFKIVLAANPTTGYSWFAKHYNAHFITLLGHEYQAPHTKRMGAGGQDVWRFRVMPQAFAAPHFLKIKMIYARPWEPQSGTVTEFTVATN